MHTLLLPLLLAASIVKPNVKPTYENVKPVEMHNATGSLVIAVDPPKNETVVRATRWAPPVSFEAFGCEVQRDRHGKIARGEKVKVDFKRLKACPSTKKNFGPCPGWKIDHIIPLCAGGCDVVANLQWQDDAASDQKDKLEVTLCWTGFKFKRYPAPASAPEMVAQEGE